MEAYHKELTALGMRMLKIVALALHIDENYFYQPGKRCAHRVYLAA